MTRPETLWVGSPHHESGRRGRHLSGIVCHIMEGSLAGCDSWFNNPASGVSAHYGIGKDGTIHQYVRDEDTAWANGKPNHPDLSIGWLNDLLSRGGNPNHVTISIENEGFTGDEMPEAQYQANLALTRALLDENGLPPDDQHVIGHNRIDSRNRAHCPGTGFPWERLFADLNAPSELVVEPEGTTDAGGVGEEPPAPDDLTLIFNRAGDIYNEADRPACETSPNVIRGLALEVQEAVNRLKGV